MIGDREVLRQALWPRAQASQLLPTPGRAGQQQAMAFADPVTTGQLEEEPAIKTAAGAEVGVFDLRVVTQPGGARSCLEALLATQRRLTLKEQREARAFSRAFSGLVRGKAGSAGGVLRLPLIRSLSKIDCIKHSGGIE
jgi:hypothetical protein